MQRVQLGFAVFLVLISSALALECYVCDTPTHGKKCKEKNPNTDKLDRYISEDKDTCHVCYKANFELLGEEETVRGCASKDAYNDFDVKKDQCKSSTLTFGGATIADADVCICDSDKCNGGALVLISMATVLCSLAFAFFV